MATKPQVFIIETLDPDDEGNDRLEGKNIAHLLRLHGKMPIYHYVRTKKQFKHAVKQFGESHYRYLHISAHGNQDGMCTTNLDEISNVELSNILKPYLKGRRLFLSACSMVNIKMAGQIIEKTQCFSVLGPRKSIAFSDAVVFWQILYHLMFSENYDGMGTNKLKQTLNDIESLLPVEIAYFSRSKKLKRGYTGDLLKKKKLPKRA